MDLPELYRSLSVFSAADQVFLRCHLDGTLFTQNAKAKFKTDTTSKCPWCPAKDGFHHRAWICPHFAVCRAHLTDDQRAVLPSLPPCLLDHGWPVLLPEWELYAGLLLKDDGLCRMSPVNPPCDCCSEVLELFVDGTAAHPTEVKLRFAAWAVTLVSKVGILDNQLLMGGHVAGLCQSPFRAELTAVVHAVTWAVARGQAVRLWCDCQSVVRGVNRLLRRRPLKKNVPHSDLWGQLAEVLSGHEEQVQIWKVVSHCAINKALDPVEQWAYWHNNLTDKAAEDINYRRSPEFWTVWEGLCHALSFHRKLHGAIQRVLLQTSKMAVASQKAPPVSAAPAPVVVDVPPVPATWVIPTVLVKRYAGYNMQLLHQWWLDEGPAMLQGPQQLCYIAGMQLFYSFNLHSGYQGPWCSKKVWYSCEADVPAQARTAWGARCGLFLRMWRCYLKGNKMVVPTKMARPASTSISRWVVCFKLRWSQAAVDRIDQFVLQQLGRQAHTPADLAALCAANTS